MISDGMLLHKITEKQIFSFIKLMAAITIFYAGLSYAVLPVGEDFSEILQKDYLEISVLGDVINPSSASLPLPLSRETTGTVKQYIQEGVQELDDFFIGNSQSHGAASNKDAQYQDRFTSICFSNVDLCDLIKWVGDYSRQEKYLYVSSVFSVVNFIQDYRIVGNDIVSVLHEIIIDNSVGDRRGYATWNDIVFNLGSVDSRAEFVGLVAHELGHVYDLGALQGVSSTKHGAFTEFGKKKFSTDDLSLQYYSHSRKSEKIRKSGSSKKDFCSGYGMSDPFEDFAECFNLYVNHNVLFKTMAKRNEILKKKYNFVANVFDGHYLHAYKDEATYLKDNSGRRPWDTTRINN